MSSSSVYSLRFTTAVYALSTPSLCCLLSAIDLCCLLSFLYLYLIFPQNILSHFFLTRSLSLLFFPTAPSPLDQANPPFYTEWNASLSSLRDAVYPFPSLTLSLIYQSSFFPRLNPICSSSHSLAFLSSSLTCDLRYFALINFCILVSYSLVIFSLIFVLFMALLGSDNLSCASFLDISNRLCHFPLALIVSSLLSFLAISLLPLLLPLFWPSLVLLALSSSGQLSLTLSSLYLFSFSNNKSISIWSYFLQASMFILTSPLLWFPLITLGALFSFHVPPSPGHLFFFTCHHYN